jgi:predicted transposase YbfD/YdcC
MTSIPGAMEWMDDNVVLSEVVRQADELANAIEEYWAPEPVPEHFAEDLEKYRMIREKVHTVYPRRP